MKIEQMADAIADELERYAGTVSDDVKQAVKAVAQDARKDVQARAAQLFKVHDKAKPYSKSWKIKTISEDANGISVILYSSKYQIAHLLEHGHVLVVKGKVVGRVQGHPHIAPAEAQAEEALGKKVRLLITGSSK